MQRTAQDKANRAQEWISQQSINVSQPGKQTIILTADTTVALGNLVLGKPKDVKHASDILQLLSGKTHTVYTAVVLSQSISETNRKWSQWQSLSATQVSFAEMTEQTIEEYIATGEPFGKAGAYGIQGHAAKFISRIEGSYSGVMGLPLFETTELMKRLVK